MPRHPKRKHNPNHNKQIRQVAEPAEGKKPQSPQIARYDHEYPAWRVSLLEMCDPFGWHEVEQPKRDDIHKKLKNFESMTWHKIFVRDKHRNHRIPVGDLCKEARNRLQEIKQDDVDELVSLRLSSVERIWGIFDRGALKLLWWDPSHAVCPSLLTHT